ncbi:MAG: hypothetical protein L3J52_02170 [Proteobacteria bacterium]|nr:hypothetical protein [Pseudomonadota bacterium]
MPDIKQFRYIKGNNRPGQQLLSEFIKKNDIDLDDNNREIKHLQEALQAEGKQSVLIIFQAMDAAGKDSTIRNVFNQCDPGGYHVVSFKAPSKEEVAHDFIWRCYKHFPKDGHITIFNRSYYEETLIVRVHPNFLRSQGITQTPDKKFWGNRFKFINQVEKHLNRNGTKVIKFMLDVSQKTQHYRFIRRYSTPDKQWKFSVGDLKESKLWDKYQFAFDQLLEKTSSKHAP